MRSKSVQRGLETLSIRLRLAWRRHSILFVLLGLAGLYFLFYYLTHPYRPAGMFVWSGFSDTTATAAGWYSYYDQSQYLNIAHILASLDFGQLSSLDSNGHKMYSYGLGYPLVAVPLIWLGFRVDPFVLFNLIAFVFAVYAVYRAAKTFISPLAGWLAGFLLIFATPLVFYTVLPWNSTVCLFAVSGILVLATLTKLTKYHALVAGLLVGWAFAARYIDVIWLSFLAVASMYRGSFKLLAKQTVLIIIGMAIVIIPVLYSHYKVFGNPFSTPYVNHLGKGNIGSSDQGLGAYSLERIPTAALGMFAGPRLAGSHDTDRGWLVSMFWVLCAIPGAIILLRRMKYKLFLVTLIGATIAAFLFYLSFRASGPDQLKFGTLHYFKMFWPGLVILATVFIGDILQKTTLLKPKKNKR